MIFKNYNYNLQLHVQVSKGYSIHIPMPGHTIGDSMMKSTINSIEHIDKLIQEHDVIFLLTDSRESRWLPTMLGAYYKKVILTLHQLQFFSN